MTRAKSFIEQLAETTKPPRLQNYATPWSIIHGLVADGTFPRGFAIDVCATKRNAKAPIFITKKQNGLLADWLDDAFDNPEYKHQEKWLERAAWWGDRGINSANLVLASTSADYWDELVFGRGRCDLYKGRIAFLHPRTLRPVKGFSHASALVLYGPRFNAGELGVRDARTGRLLRIVERTRARRVLTAA